MRLIIPVHDELISAKSCSFEPFVAIATPVPQGRTPARGRLWRIVTGRSIRVAGKEFSAMERSAQNSGTIEVRSAHKFDDGALEQWLEREVEGCCGPLRVEQFRGGQSNPTYKLITPG